MLWRIRELTVVEDRTDLLVDFPHLQESGVSMDRGRHLQLLLIPTPPKTGPLTLASDMLSSKWRERTQQNWYDFEKS